MRKTLPAIVIILFLFANALGAAPLSDYRSRVGQAQMLLSTYSENQSYSVNDIANVKELLPKSEQVEFDGQTITVDNAWLHTLIDSARGATNSNTRADRLHEASTRLAALAEHLDHLGAAGVDNASDSRQKVRDILSRKEFLKKEDDPITAFIKKARQAVLDFFNSLIRKIFELLFGGNAGANWVFRGLVLAVMAGVLLLAIRMLARIKRKPKRRDKKRTVLGEEIEAGTTSKDLADVALLAAREGDFRGAVRKLYISLLYDLAERNLIELEPNATNREYLAKVSSFQTLASPMRYLTEKFDYFWYGMFPSSAEDFSLFHARYSEAIDRARSLSNQPVKA